MCFSTNKLQSLNLIGNIFDVSKSARPLTIQDYISILIDNDKYLDNELLNMINNLPFLSSRSKRVNNQTVHETDILGSRTKFDICREIDFVHLDVTMDEKLQTGEYSSSSNDLSSRTTSDSDSIVRGILSNSIKYNHEKQPGLKMSFLLLLIEFFFR
jgi:hypothetical protein